MTMMDARNSVGRKISLLNDSSGDVAPIPGKPTTAASAAPTSCTAGATGAVPVVAARPLHHHHAYHKQYQPPLLPHTTTLPPLLSAHSRASSSCTSTPCLSPPQTPQLVRSDSSDSRIFATPSPLTPSYNSFDQQQHHHHQQHPLHKLSTSSRTTSSTTLPSVASLAIGPPSSASAKVPQQHYYFVNNRTSSSTTSTTPTSAGSKMDDPISSLYPPIPDATLGMSSAYALQPQMSTQGMSLPQDPASLMYRSSNSPASEPSHVSSASAASTNHTGAAQNNSAKQAVPKKNQYPCPMAKQFNCSDYFTTSGHAARHAKKHTGKKDAFCPECNKAFTRKDNMEQHRRTHQNGRGTGRGSDDKVKKSVKLPVKKPSSVKSEQPLLEAAVEQQLAQQRQEELASQLQAVAQAQIAVAQQQQHLQAVEQSILNNGSAGPYFLSGLDAGPIPSLPMPTMNDISIRPPLHRSNLTSSLDYMPPMLGPLDPETLNYSYPSPGLSNGLNSLALAASEHRRLSEEKAKSPASEPSLTPSTESP